MWERKPSRCISLERESSQRGAQTCLQALLEHNAKVYLAARTATKANAAIADLKNETGKEAIFLQLDLADLTAVRKSAEEFLSFVPSSGVSAEVSLTIL